MAPIPPPYEILQLEAGQSVTFHVVRYEVGSMFIHPTWPGAPEEKEIRGIRIHVKPEDKAWLPAYWDVTPRHLVEGLEPLLSSLARSGKAVTLKAILTRPPDPASKRFSIAIEA